MSPQEIIKHYKLKKHPEGGYFRRSFTSKIIANENVISTAIYYLIESGNPSHFHSIKSDEMWHFYSGSPLKIHMFSPEEKYHHQIIDNSNLLTYPPQCNVPANYIFAAEVINKNSFSFVGCTVSPGFRFEDFTLYSGNEMKNRYPKNFHQIAHLCK